MPFTAAFTGAQEGLERTIAYQHPLLASRCVRAQICFRSEEMLIEARGLGPSAKGQCPW